MIEVESDLKFRVNFKVKPEVSSQGPLSESQTKLRREVQMSYGVSHGVSVTSEAE
jgi:hypothetical protein